jgi:hypothetical protein
MIFSKPLVSCSVGCAKYLNFSFQNQQFDYSYIAINERFTEKETNDFQ